VGQLLTVLLGVTLLGLAIIGRGGLCLGLATGLATHFRTELLAYLVYSDHGGVVVGLVLAKPVDPANERRHLGVIVVVVVVVVASSGRGMAAASSGRRGRGGRGYRRGRPRRCGGVRRR
jgi:hypothetical protein